MLCNVTTTIIGVTYIIKKVNNKINFNSVSNVIELPWQLMYHVAHRMS